MSSVWLQKCLYYSNAQTKIIGGQRYWEIGTSETIREGWCVMAFNEPTKQLVFTDKKRTPIYAYSYFIPRTYKGLPIIGVMYTAGDYYNNKYAAYGTPNVYYHNDSIMFIMPNRKGFAPMYYGDDPISTSRFNGCMFQYTKSNPRIQLLKSRAYGDIKYCYTSLGKINMTLNSTYKRYAVRHGKPYSYVSTENDEICINGSPNHNDWSGRNYGKYFGSLFHERLTCSSIDQMIQEEFDANQAVFAWVLSASNSRMSGLGTISLSVATIDGTDELIDVSNTDDSSSIYR